MNPRTPQLQSTRLLDQVRERARYLHYSLSTEKAYLYWVRFFVRWHGLRHPRDMGPPEVQGFLTMLAAERRVSSSTHNQALSALLFLYREVLAINLPWLQDLQRPARTRRIPTVLTRAEVSAVLGAMGRRAACGSRIASRNRRVWRCPMRWRESIRRVGESCAREFAPAYA